MAYWSSLKLVRRTYLPFWGLKAAVFKSLTVFQHTRSANFVEHIFVKSYSIISRPLWGQNCEASDCYPPDTPRQTLEWSCSGYRWCPCPEHYGCPQVCATRWEMVSGSCGHMERLNKHIYLKFLIMFANTQSCLT